MPAHNYHPAASINERVKTQNETIFGPEHPPILIRMTYLASTYHNSGLWKEAEVLEVQVMEAGPGLEHPDTR